MLIEHLETERLALRPATVADAAAVFAYASDPAVSRYLPWAPHVTISDTKKFLSRCEQQWEDRQSFPWVIVLRETGTVEGMIEANITGHRASIGYVLARPMWGLGIATEAAEAVVSALFEHSDVWRVWATCDIDNPASARVLEKAGLTLEGTLHRWDCHNISPEPRDAFVYAAWRDQGRLSHLPPATTR
ncbi:MAG: GNAT family N-acetyltransferase [Acidimicrobiia bacterium]